MRLQFNDALPFAILIATLAVLTAGPTQAQPPTAVTSIINSDQDMTLEVNYDGGLYASGDVIGLFESGTRADSIPAEPERR